MIGLEAEILNRIRALISSVAPLTWQSKVYDTAGTYTFTVPTGVKKVYITACGAGSGGAGAANTGGTYGGAGGGGGGWIFNAPVSIPKGMAQFGVTVGAGGAGGVGATSGSAGGTTSVGYFWVQAFPGGVGTTGHATAGGGYAAYMLPIMAHWNNFNVAHMIGAGMTGGNYYFYRYYGSYGFVNTGSESVSFTHLPPECFADYDLDSGAGGASGDVNGEAGRSILYDYFDSSAGAGGGGTGDTGKYAGGGGGGSYLGNGGGGGSHDDINGKNATGNGAGGGGGCANTGVAANGGNGSDGYVLIEWQGAEYGS